MANSLSTMQLVVWRFSAELSTSNSLSQLVLSLLGKVGPAQVNQRSVELQLDCATCDHTQTLPTCAARHSDKAPS
jgi:hypothetical protein